jgi:hypothetical protein
MLASSLILWALSPGSSFALESTWLVDNAVLMAGEEIEAKTSATPITFADIKGGIFSEEVELLCNSTYKGTIGPGKADRTTEVLFKECETKKGLCGEPEAAPVNLPWLTNIELIGNEYYDDVITTQGTKNVGYKIICDKVTEDTCELPLTRPLLYNTVFNEIGVEYDSNNVNQPKFNCTRGGASTGRVNGIYFIPSTKSGLAVAVGEG